MKTMSLHILLMAMLCALSGCVTLYKPGAIHSPLLKDKDEMHISGSIGASGTGLWNVQTGYAVGHNAALIADGMFHSRSTDYDNNSYGTTYKLRILSGTLGAGYFTRFGELSRGLFQCYGGGGYGYSNDRIYQTGRTSAHIGAQYSNAFLQPGFAFLTDHAELSFDVRGNYVHMFNIKGYNYSQSGHWDSNIGYYIGRSPYFVNLEPTVTVKAGSKRLKGMVQLGATIPTVNAEAYFAMNSASLLLYPLIKINFGISYSFAFQRGLGDSTDNLLE